MSDAMKCQEEAKRNARQTAAERWQAYLALLAWAAQQSTAPQRTPAALKAKERRLLAGLADWQAIQRARASERGSSALAEG